MNKKFEKQSATTNSISDTLKGLDDVLPDLVSERATDKLTTQTYNYLKYTGAGGKFNTTIKKQFVLEQFLCVLDIRHYGSRISNEN